MIVCILISGSAFDGAAAASSDAGMSQQDAIRWSQQLMPSYAKGRTYKLEWVDWLNGMPSEEKILQIAYYDKEYLYEPASTFLADLTKGEVLRTDTADRYQQEPLSFPLKVNREQAITVALKFVHDAVPSLSAAVLKEYESTYLGALLGPLLYRFEFMTDPEARNHQSISIGVNGDGNVVYFDAVGSLEGMTFDEMKELSDGYNEKTLPSDWAANKNSVALAALYKNGVILGTESLDKKLTFGEFIRFVRKAIVPDASVKMFDPHIGALFADVRPNYEDYDSVFFFDEEHWAKRDKTKKLNVDALLTREQEAYYLAKVTGLDKLAQAYAKDNIVTELKDFRTLQLSGADAVMLKAGWMAVANGKFNPSGPVTLNELASALYKASLFKSNFAKAIPAKG